MWPCWGDCRIKRGWQHLVSLTTLLSKRFLRSTQAWEWRDQTIGQLSGGERQRVLLARALAVQADVLLMDEPLLNLDPPHQSDWIDLVRTLTAQGKTVVSVLHEATVALQADDMVIYGQGHHQACGFLYRCGNTFGFRASVSKQNLHQNN